MLFYGKHVVSVITALYDEVVDGENIVFFVEMES